MRREHRKKLSLNRETLKNLDADSMSRVVGGLLAQSATSGEVCCSFPSDATCDPLPPLRTCNSQGPCWCPPNVLG
jgi:hypothetical protein